jgi:hypothetical protein
MVEADLTTLTFVGGPFDGFDEQIPAHETLPRCVALPMNEDASEVFGIEVANQGLPRIAIYKLHMKQGSASYQFHKIHAIEEIAAAHS